MNLDSMASITIRLSKGKGSMNSRGGNREGSDMPEAGAGAAESIPREQGNTDLLIARGASSSLANLVTKVQVVGRHANRKPGNKVHFCIRCDFPIAVYGRLDPCQHVFCLSCAKKRPECFLCEEKVARIQKMDVLEGMYICGAPACLHSFLTQEDFEWHIREAHMDILQVGDVNQAAHPSNNQESTQQYYYQQVLNTARQRQLQHDMLPDKRQQKRKHLDNQQWNPPGPGEGFTYDQWKQMTMYQQRHDEVHALRMQHHNSYLESQGFDSSTHVQ